MWYALDENGEVTNKMTDKPDSGIPVMRWKG